MMAEIKITDKLIGSLSEVYYKEYCDQNGWAYISLEQIHERGVKKGILKFKKGFDRIYVKIPEEIIAEIEEISKPSSKSLTDPSYVYDFLACKVGNWRTYPLIFDNIEKKDFRWIEVKTGYSKLTTNQINTLEKISLPLFRYRVPYPLQSPVYVHYDEVNSQFLYEHNLGV